MKEGRSLLVERGGEGEDGNTRARIVGRERKK